MRSPAQQQRRLTVDRANLRRGAMNYHYENMKTSSAIEGIAADQLHCDNGYSDLSSVMKFDWTGVYGQSPVPSAADAAYVLWTQRWAVAERVREALAGLLAEERSALGVDRLDRWVEALEVPGIPIRITVGGDPSAALVGAPGYPAPAGAGTAAHEGPIDWSIEVDADGTSGRVIVRPADGHACRNAPLVAVVPVGPGSPVFAYANHKPATFELSRGSYFLAIEPLGSVGVRFGVAAKCS